MADQPKNPRSLSEISHLFLSAVRDRQTRGVARPQRTPPPPRGASVDLTPEELRHVFEPAPEEPTSAEPATPAYPPAKAILASHLGQRQIDALRRYARNIAAGGERVGLIFVDACEFRLMTFQLGQADSDGVETGCFDARAMREAINELSCDLDCWLIAIGSPRIPEARALLRRVDEWVVLSACDNEGIIASYRMLKGLADAPRPRLSLAAIDCQDPAQAEGLYRKLSGVCRQFLDWSLDEEPSVGEPAGVAECAVMCCRTQNDKAQLAAAVHWQVVEELLNQPRRTPSETSMNPPPPATPEMKLHETPAPTPVRPQPPTAIATPGPMLEIVDLPEDAADDEAVLSAILRHSMSQVIECPVRPPMCESSRLAVTRDRRLVLIALAGRGLSELRSVGLAYQWMAQNRQLLAMAMPQFSLDIHQPPLVRLLVDQADLDAEALSPLLKVETVAIQSYRRVRWGHRVGLLLQAA